MQVTIRAGDIMSQSSNKHELLLAAIGSFLAWTDTYFILHALNQRFSAEWNCRLVTVAHAIISTALSFTSAVITGPWPFSYVGEANTSFHNTIMIISFGYFAFDFLWCLYMRSEGAVMLAHHLVSLFSIVYSLYQGRSGSELTAVMGASELTNPLLQLRWFLKESGQYKGRLAVIIDCLFISLFWTARLGVGSVFHFVCQTSPKLDLATKVGGQAFYIISVIFGIQIVMYGCKKYLYRRK